MHPEVSGWEHALTVSLHTETEGEASKDPLSLWQETRGPLWIRLSGGRIPSSLQWQSCSEEVLPVLLYLVVPQDVPQRDVYLQQDCCQEGELSRTLDCPSYRAMMAVGDLSLDEGLYPQVVGDLLLLRRSLAAGWVCSWSPRLGRSLAVWGACRRSPCHWRSQSCRVESCPLESFIEYRLWRTWLRLYSTGQQSMVTLLCLDLVSPVSTSL